MNSEWFHIPMLDPKPDVNIGITSQQELCEIVAAQVGMLLSMYGEIRRLQHRSDRSKRPATLEYLWLKPTSLANSGEYQISQISYHSTGNFLVKNGWATILVTAAAGKLLHQYSAKPDSGGEQSIVDEHCTPLSAPVAEELFFANVVVLNRLKGSRMNEPPHDIEQYPRAV
jgi:hypothetical protein